MGKYSDFYIELTCPNCGWKRKVRMINKDYQLTEGTCNRCGLMYRVQRMQYNVAVHWQSFVSMSREAKEKLYGHSKI